MFKNFFVVAYRNMLRSKGFSVINVSGLAIGMASAMLILLWVQNEYSYDSFYANTDRLYQVWNNYKGNDGINSSNITTKMMAPALKKDYPEIERAARLFWDETILFSVGDKKINVTGNMADADFLPMFGFPFLAGDMNTALNDPDNIVITQSFSKKFFGDEDAMGKIIKVDNKYNFRVSGVMKDLPANTQFDFEYLLPWSYMKTTGQDDSCWGCGSTHNYVLLKEGANLSSVNTKISNIVTVHTDTSNTSRQFLYPVSKLRLYSGFENGKPAGGKIGMIKLFTLIAFFILLIACINFTNMSTALSEKRAKEVGIRKVIGAQKKSLVMQFLGESMLTACIAGVFALIIVQLCLPAFNALIGQELVVNKPVIRELHMQYTDIRFLLAFAGFVLFTGVVAGIYPAFFLSSFKPVEVLKGTFKKVHALITPRKVLVVLQFTFSVIFIVCTIIMHKQIAYTQDRQTGYDKNNLVYVPLAGDIKKNYDLIKNDLLHKGIAAGVSKGSAPITEGWSSGSADWEGKDPADKTEFNYYNSDGSLVQTTGMQLLQGRDIDLKNYKTDSSAIVLNEAAVKVMGFKKPLGQVINRDNGLSWHVIGVVKDFILQSPYEPIKPMIIRGPLSDWFNVIHVRFTNTHSIAQSIAAMENVFRQYNPGYPVEYYFVDARYAAKFSSEQTTATLTVLFAGLTIFISCLGLFGLATYMAENRIKEIGVRKVLGASVASITALLSIDFIRLVLIAIVIASPIAWWSMSTWLAGYSYRIAIPVWVFFMAGFTAIFIALLTVSFQAIRAAVANPVKSLRTG